jgi:hypothetical protein
MWKVVVAVACSLALSACASIEGKSFGASIEAVSAGTFNPGLRHRVVYEGAEEATNPVLLEVIDQARAMLQASGVTLAEPTSAADVVVTVAFLQWPAVVNTYTTREAVYGPTGIASSRSVERTDKQGRKVTTTTYQRDYGIVGYEDVQKASAYYPYVLTLKAYDLRGGRRGFWPMWTVEAKHYSGKSTDRYLAYLLRAGQPYVGKMTKTWSEVAWNDPTAQRIAASARRK